MERAMNANMENAAAASRWLKAYDDPTAALYTFTQCLALCDVHGDGDHKLVIGDLGTGSAAKLKVYKGTSVVSENSLLDVPTAVVAFHMDTSEPRVPAIGVASAAHIYIYKNLRPYFKFTLPSLSINAAEQDIWNQARDDKVDVVTLREVLESVRNEIGEPNLTGRSRKFLTLEVDEMLAFANSYKHAALKKQTLISCLGTLKKSMSDDDAISCLVLGTESRNVYVLDPQAFTILATVNLPSVPVFLSVLGLFDVEYQIGVSCRDGQVYVLKRGVRDAEPCIELAYQVVCLETIAKNLVVATTDMTLSCFTPKGKLLWRSRLRATITATAVVELRQLGTTLLAVASGDGLVSFYSDRTVVDELRAGGSGDPVVAMKFGRFGREDNTLVMVTSGGALLVRILRRTARFDATQAAHRTPLPVQGKMSIPKKTKLFIDQTMRERENCPVMHRVYQQDLYKLRLSAARAYVDALESSLDPVDPREPVKLSVRVQGLGPVFCLKVELQNTSDRKSTSDLAVTFACDPNVYALDKYFIPVPMLVPGTEYTFRTTVKCLQATELISHNVKVLVFKLGQLSPVVSATLSMPVSEPSNPS